MSTLTDIMSTQLITLSENSSLTDARHKMVENRIRHLPVVNDKQELIALVSQRDVLAAEESSVLNINAEQRLAREKRILVKDFYKTNVLSISPDCSLQQAALFMQKHKIGCLPITSENKLLGMITDSDFVNVAINLMELASEPDYLMS